MVGTCESEGGLIPNSYKTNIICLQVEIMINFTKSSLENVDMILQSVQNSQNHVQIVFKQALWLRHWTLFLK